MGRQRTEEKHKIVYKGEKVKTVLEHSSLEVIVLWGMTAWQTGSQFPNIYIKVGKM